MVARGCKGTEYSQVEDTIGMGKQGGRWVHAHMGIGRLILACVPFVFVYVCLRFMFVFCVSYVFLFFFFSLVCVRRGGVSA